MKNKLEFQTKKEKNTTYGHDLSQKRQQQQLHPYIQLSPQLHHIFPLVLRMKQAGHQMLLRFKHTHTHSETQTATKNEIQEILERCEVQLRRNGFLGRGKFIEGAVDYNGKRKYKSEYDYWLDYKNSLTTNK